MPHLSHSPTPEEKRLRRKIAELRAKDHLPEEMVAVVSGVAELQLAAQAGVRFTDGVKQELPPGLAARLAPPESRAQGAFLLPRREFPLDMASTVELVPAVLRVLAGNGLHRLKEELEGAFQAHPDLLEEACRAALESSPGSPAVRPDGGESPEPETAAGNTSEAETRPFSRWEKSHPEAPSFFRFVVQSAIMPSLAVAGQLLGRLHGTDPWPHGHCPVCGSQPLIARLDGAEGARTHVCSFCAFEYRVPRLGCPFCLNVSAENSEYLSSDEEPGYLLDVCHECKTYIKIVDFRQYDRAWVPMLDDLASLTLDLRALQMGYNRPTLSAWGF